MKLTVVVLPYMDMRKAAALSPVWSEIKEKGLKGKNVPENFLSC